MAAHGTTASPVHPGRRTGFVDEDQPFGVETGLGLEPGPTASQHVRSPLLEGASVCLKVTPLR